MKWHRLFAAMLIFAIASPAQGQPARRDPHIGYVFPAGGRRGTTFTVVVGGQFLNGTTDAFVSSRGVSAEVAEQFRPLKNSFTPEEREALNARFTQLLNDRLSELEEQGIPVDEAVWRLLERAGTRGQGEDEQAGSPIDWAAMPKHAIFYDLESMSLRELLHARYMLRVLRKGQRNPQIAQTVVLKVTIDPDVPPGVHELRLRARGRLTNPMAFEVGMLPEMHETESDDSRIARFLPPEPPMELPVLINGQIMPGDVDRFRFVATKGQSLVIEAAARRLLPYLADAVPGWFQATLTLYDEADNELAFVDDYRFNPDPVFRFDVPADGVYTLEIRDSIYRGREDFVYRISIGELPFVTSIFPLGCSTGQKRFVSAEGWNLCADRLVIDGRTDPTIGIRQKPLGQGRTASNPVTYEINSLKARAEAEPNDDVEAAQRVLLPRIIDGRIDKPGDVDMFRFSGRQGDVIVVETIARRLRSPLDSLVRMTDDQNAVLGWNDDASDRREGFLHADMGVLTHHADSYLQVTLPKDGTYYVQLSDAQSHGGEAFAYRLRISPPRPDFELRATPSSVNMRAGLAEPIHVYALRQDGFKGEIEIAIKGETHGFSLGGAKIPAGKDSVRVTLIAPRRPPENGLIVLTLEGRAAIAAEQIVRPVVPSEDMMQAFLYRHLTPSQELMVSVQGGGRLGRDIRVSGKTPIRLRPGGATHVHVAVPPHPKLKELRFTLDQPPLGIALSNLTTSEDGIEFDLTASNDVQLGLVDNLIIEVLRVVEGGEQDGGRKPKKNVSTLGYLPAIPIMVVAG